LQEKGLLAGDVDIRIRDTISALENYIALNDLIPNKRRIAPLTSSQQPFITFSERELAIFFWRRGVLKQRLVDLALADEDSTAQRSPLCRTSRDGYDSRSPDISSKTSSPISTPRESSTDKDAGQGIEAQSSYTHWR